MVMEDYRPWIKANGRTCPQHSCDGVDILAWKLGACPQFCVEAADFFENISTTRDVRAVQLSRHHKLIGRDVNWRLAFVNCDSCILGIVQQDPAADASSLWMGEKHLDDRVHVIRCQIAIIIRKGNNRTAGLSPSRISRSSKPNSIDSQTANPPTAMSSSVDDFHGFIG
jgi:hypothetical protein